MVDLSSIGKEVKKASRQLALVSAQKKNDFINDLAEKIIHQQDMILEANQVDISAGRQAGLAESMIDRLVLTPARLKAMAVDLREISLLPDPVGEIFDRQVLDNGLQVHKQRVPLGVVAVIYESRPNVTVDVCALAIKSGNAVILRGGTEAIHSNRALVEVIRAAMRDNDLPAGAVGFIDNPDRQLVLELLKMHETIDMVIPRGSAALHNFCKENSMIPVIVGGMGICHLFVDESADLQTAVKVIHNAKTQRPTVCNALDTVLVHAKISQEFLPQLVSHLAKDGVTFRADAQAYQVLEAAHRGTVLPAGAQDFDTEWLSLILGIKVVSTLEEAIAHIAAHSTGHSDGILTGSTESAAKFISEVDSAAVYVNASTRFTDGAQLGLGAEVAISTQRLHARGPMGLRELTTYKWVIVGEGQVRQ